MTELSIPYPTIGIDLDGTITENTLFFHVFSHNWPGRIIIVTFRDDYDKAEQDLASLYIKYDELVLAEDMDKSSIIEKYNIDVYFDDQDEMIKNIPSSVSVLKMRNGGNFDFDENKWIYSEDTGTKL